MFKYNTGHLINQRILTTSYDAFTVLTNFISMYDNANFGHPNLIFCILIKQCVHNHAINNKTGFYVLATPWDNPIWQNTIESCKTKNKK